MKLNLTGVEHKLARALNHIQQLEVGLRAFSDSKPFNAQVWEDTHDGRPLGRLVAIRNVDAKMLDVSWTLLAGEALYQLRSGLDHLVHAAVAANGNGELLERSRRHQFPIFVDAGRYYDNAPAMLEGMPTGAIDAIATMQPFARRPEAPARDPLWILQHLNNTDKHRLIPLAVVAIGDVRCYDHSGLRFSVNSPDIELRDGQPFFTFDHKGDGSYRDLVAHMTCVAAFADAMNLGGHALGMDHMLRRVHQRVWVAVEHLRQLISHL